jgi:hypothetical protein
MLFGATETTPSDPEECLADQSSGFGISDVAMPDTAQKVTRTKDLTDADSEQTGAITVTFTPSCQPPASGGGASAQAAPKTGRQSPSGATRRTPGPIKDAIGRG